MMVAASRPDARWIGVDVGYRWLVLAASRLRDRGLPAMLVCAGADRLPIADGAVDLVAAESLYENAPSAPAALAESARVLRSGGWLCLTTPNKLSVGPDPHVGMPLGGWMPDRVVAAWAARRGMIPPRRHLFSARTLRDSITSLPFDDVRLGLPPITDAQLTGASGFVRAGVRAYRLAGRTSGGRSLLLAIGPSLLAVAQRR
jgi:SAM-dependent methyltransferase